jgi:hypothetical protein
VVAFISSNKAQQQQQQQQAQLSASFMSAT